MSDPADCKSSFYCTQIVLFLGFKVWTEHYHLYKWHKIFKFAENNDSDIFFSQLQLFITAIGFNYILLLQA